MSGKRVLIEFLGGDMDGRTLDSDSSDPSEKKMIESCLAMTDNGTLGRAVHGFSMTTTQAMARGEIAHSDLKRPKGTHQYTVAERLDEGDETLIRMRYSVRPLQSEPDKKSDDE